MIKTTKICAVKTTKICTVGPSSSRLTGDEQYRVIGGLASDADVRKIWPRFKGLLRHWSCIEKATIVFGSIGLRREGIEKSLVVGSLAVFSEDMGSSYGYAFRPPLEFHAWVDIDGMVFDFALPGVIEKGLSLSDREGPVLVGRRPVILAGKPPAWAIYTPCKVLSTARAVRTMEPHP